MKRSPLRSKGTSDVSKIKRQIQKALHDLVVIRDGGCILRFFPISGQCSGPLQADHLNSRQFSVSYGDSRNVVCICQRHHLYWKKQNPIIYAEIIKLHIMSKPDGMERWRYLEQVMADRKAYSFGRWEWEKVLLGLKKEIAELTA